MAKNKDEEKSMLVATIPLQVEKWQADRLNKRFDTAKVIYNSLLCKRNNLYHRYTHSPEYIADSKKIEELYKEYEEKYPENKKKAKEQVRKDPVYKEIYTVKRNKQLKELGFTEFGFMKDATVYAKHYPTIAAKMAEMSIGRPMWSAFEKLIYKDGKKVSFKGKARPMNSLASDGRSGIRLSEDEKGKPYIVMKGGNRKNDLIIYLKEKAIDPHKKGILLGNIKVIRVIRRMEKTRWHYYAQFTAENPVIVKNPDHEYGYGKVGLFIDNHTGDLVAVSKDRTYHTNLMLDHEKVYEKVAKIQAEIEKLKIQNNPDNYEENGTIKKGIVGEDGKRRRLIWHISNRHRDLNRQKRELERKLRERKDINRYVVIHQLLSMGDEFYIKKTSRDLERTKQKEDQKIDKSNTELHQEREQRKLFQAIGASNLITKLNSMLKSSKKEPVHENTINKTHYFYQHEEDVYYSKKYHGDMETSDGMVEVKDKMIPKGDYFAFINMYYDDEKQKYDKEQIEKDIIEFDFYKRA